MNERFDLRSEVTRVADTSGLADPAAIAEKVIENLTPAQRRAALAATMPGYVRLIVAAKSRDIRVTRPAVGVSKADRVRSWAQRMRALRLYVAGEWRLVNECTPSDLRTVASQREAQAEQIRAEGESWLALADLMDAQGVRSVAELADAELESWRAAA